MNDIPEPDRAEGAVHPRHTTHLIGQASAEADFLKAFNQGRLHHAWMICGPRGVGKATLAWKMARFLLNQPSNDAGMFGETQPNADTLDIDANQPVARRTAALAEPRLFLCRRPYDEKAKRLKRDITVDEVRKLSGFFHMSAADGGRRVVIIDAADEMNTSAANALLKILEEPPDNCTILLVAHRPLALLPTIRSRCRTLNCKTLSVDDMRQALAPTDFEMPSDANKLAMLAKGSVGAAIRILSQDGLNLHNSLMSLLKKSPRMDRTSMLTLANACVGKGNESRYELTFNLISFILHQLALTGVSRTSASGITDSDTDILSRLCSDDAQARCWATLAQEIEGRAARGRAVNLDPASVILDMLIKIDQTAGKLVPA